MPQTDSTPPTATAGELICRHVPRAVRVQYTLRIRETRLGKASAGVLGVLLLADTLSDSRLERLFRMAYGLTVDPRSPRPAKLPPRPKSKRGASLRPRLRW